jgi:hypothetical protein
MSVLMNNRASRMAKKILKPALWQQSLENISYRLRMKREPTFSELTSHYNVIIMKHCFPASDVLEDTGKVDPSSPRQSLENYKTIYRLLRDRFDISPGMLFIAWTLPPRHRLCEPPQGNKEGNAARATDFSNWLKGEFIEEGGPHPNIYVWDFRGIVTDPNTNFLKYDYERDHDNPDSHPNELANNEVGPMFAQFIVDTITDFSKGEPWQTAKIMFLCHSTGRNVYNYTDLGLKAWFARHNSSNRTSFSMQKRWYPVGGNMPVDYYHSWLGN